LRGRLYLRENLSDDEAQKVGIMTLDDDPFTDQIDLVDRFLAYLKALLDDVRGGHLPTSPPRRAASSIERMGQVTIVNSNIGNLNLGTVGGDMEARLSIFDVEGRGEVAEAIRRLAGAIASSTTLGAKQQDALRCLEVMLEEGAKRAEQRSVSRVKASWTALQGLLGTAVDLKAAWDVAAPYLRQFLGQ
jgi:hypothetical protein